MVTAAVVGCGDVSSVHLDAIRRMEDVHLVALCDTDQQALEDATLREDVPGFTDHQAMLAEARPDVVHICTPHHQHANVAIDCLEAGVDVILEKPLAHTEAEGRRLVEAAQRSRAKIGISLQNRYNAPVQEIRRLIASGELGEIRGASATVIWTRTPEYYAAKPWRATWAGSGGGLLMNQAVHTVDLVQWLLGEVTDVRGHAATHRLDIEVEDTAEMVLTHASGARSVLFASNDNVVNDPVTLRIDAEHARLDFRGDLAVTWADGHTDHVPERVADHGGRDYWGVSHEVLIQDFYDRRGDVEPFWIGPSAAAESLRIIKQVYAQSYPDVPLELRG